jgi:hypothetical protein
MGKRTTSSIFRVTRWDCLEGSITNVCPWLESIIWYVSIILGKTIELDILHVPRTDMYF